ncbi:MAG: LysR family transcriptional regulator, partial [Alphaproteobacteria bacterium]
MDRLAAMRAFVAVVDEGGFTAAAAKLRTSKSAVSVFVRELEAVLGTALLTRTTRRMRLTEAGERFKARAEQILNDVEEAEREASALTQRPSGLLRVSAGVSFGMRYLGCAIA